MIPPANPMHAADIRNLHSSVCFLEDRHDLAFRKFALFHRFVCVVAARNSIYGLFRIRGLLQLLEVSYSWLEPNCSIRIIISSGSIPCSAKKA